MAVRGCWEFSPQKDEEVVRFHRGFWMAYESVRGALISSLIAELEDRPSVNDIKIVGECVGVARSVRRGNMTYRGVYVCGRA